MLHSLLKRQLKKSGLTDNDLPTIEEWQNFLNRINRAYLEADQERYLLERSLTISSKEMHQLYDRLQKSETRYALASQGANDGLWDWDLSNEDIYYSKHCLDILGVTIAPDQKTDRSLWLDKIHPEDQKRVISEFKAHLKGETQHFQNEHQVLHSDGTYRWVLVRGLAIRDKQGLATRIAGSLTDITERKIAEQKLAHDAIHDALTGLPNRKFLMERLSRTLDRLKFSHESYFAVLFIDLDKFKIVNDTLGHQAGDELLLKITQKLKYLVRPSDMIARLGGDEFVILVENLKEKKQVFKIADRIIKELKKPIQILEQTIYSSASIGITFGSEEYANADDLVRDADIAMYCAKLKGQGFYELFDSQMHTGAVSYLQTQNDLRNALENKEFSLNYQPIISLDKGKIVGFESLIRWMHPTRGIIMPDDFIPITEENGLILSIGKWVIYESCRQMREWQLTFPETEDFVMNVNLSPSQLEQEDLIKQICDILDATKLAPRCLKLEITESVLMKNTEKAIKTVSDLQKLGIKVSIDDFGTGYSSLSYLHNFSIDTLKVDRSFINLIGSEKEKTEIIQTIIALAKNLGIDVVAEGVETREQLNFLRDNDCEYGQGFYYSKPINGISATQMLKEFAERDFDFQPICEIMELVEA